jgi:CDP-diacylglycerol pyrophosphatase
MGQSVFERMATRTNFGAWALASILAVGLSSAARADLLTQAQDCLNAVEKGTAKPKSCITAIKRGAYMIVPTERVTGIEQYTISPPPVRHFFEYGWEWLHTNIHQSDPGDLGMAINSENIRSQNQFHIHLACSLPGIKNDLRKLKFAPKKWIENATVGGKTYNVYLLSDLAAVFQTLDDFAKSKKDKIDDHSIAVIPNSTSEFFVLDTKKSSEAALEEGAACKSH